MHTIGVFDSGVGGLSVARAIQAAHPNDTVIFVDDAGNMPYGEKTADEILSLVQPKLHELIEASCEVIVIACNTVTMTVIGELRKDSPVPLIGLDPMVKPAAALTKTGVIAVCATPATLGSDRYKHLKNEFAKDITVIEPDCSGWADMVQHDTVDEAKIARDLQPALKNDVDVVVLACTHYHWLQPLIAKIMGNDVTILQPEAAIIAQLKTVLNER